jgi:Glutamate-1-semialdehyde aminotransferase
MTEEKLTQERLRMLPPIRRARLWRLYSEKGERYLDFWMDGGRSILGAKGTGIGTIAKAAVDTGLTRPFPNRREARLEKALLAAYPGYEAARFYRSEERASAAALASHNALSDLSPNALEVIHPFGEYLRTEISKEPARIAMPLLPCPAPLAPAVLLFAKKEDAEAAGGELVEPLYLACAERSLYEFARFRLTYNEELWRKADRRLKAHFERKGPYLFPRCAAAEYGAAFASALSGGVLLSPRYEEPSLIPGDFDDGEIKRLVEALEKRT